MFDGLDYKELLTARLIQISLKDTEKVRQLVACSGVQLRISERSVKSKV